MYARTILIIVFFFCCFAPCFTAAQQAPYLLDEVVVTAERIGSPVREAPANVTIITREEMEGSGSQTLTDVLEKEPNVFGRSQLGNPKFSSIDIRGYGETAPQNVLFLIDGRRVNNVDTTGTDLSQIPVEMIERVEVYRGPANVLYGDNAQAGVINIILRKGEGKPKVTASTTVGGYNYVKPEVYVSGQQGKFSYFTLGSYVDSDGYRHNNAFLGRDLMGNFTFDVSKNLALTAKAGHHRDDYGQPGRILWSDLRAGRVDRKDSLSPDDKASTEDSFVDFDVSAKIWDGIALSLGGSYRDRHTASFFDYGFGSFNEQKSRLETFGFTPKLTVDKALFDMKNTLVTGFDYYKYPTSVNNTADFFGPSRTVTDIDKTQSGLYVNDRFHPSADLLLEAGYRTEKAGYDVKHTDSFNAALNKDAVRHEEEEAYRFAVNYAFSKSGNIFVSYAKGFRFPATDELVIPGSCFLGSCMPTQLSSLVPQTGNEINLGLRWNPSRYAGGSVTLFRTKNQNEIFFNPLTFANENYDRTKREGIETNIFLNFTKGFRLDLSYSYLTAQFDGGQFDGNDIPLVPHDKFSGKLSYNFKAFTANLIGVYTGPRFAVSDQGNEGEKLSGYTVFDASLGYTYKNLSALFTIKNLTGTRYSDIAVFSPSRNVIVLYPNPERQYFLRLAYTFGG